MCDKKENEKNGTVVSDFANPVCQDTFQSLPKIYVTIKNKVITNKINFYQNIKRKERLNLMKSFNKTDIIEQTERIVQRKPKDKQLNKSNVQKKPYIKIDEGFDAKKMARFEDKFHKFATKPVSKHSKLHTSSEAYDNQSKHKIRFNTIKFLPLLHKQNETEDDINNSPSLGKGSVSKSISINTPLVHLYRQDKQVIKLKHVHSQEENSNESEVISPAGRRNLTSKNRKQPNIKQRIKTDQGSSHEENMEIRRSSLKTQFSKRLHDDKKTSSNVGINGNKFHIPTRQQYKSFIQNYTPMNPSFNLKQIIKKENFQIISYQDGVYFGISQLGIKNGQGILVTQTSIFQGLFENDEKIRGCEQNIDGKYFGNFKNGLREGKGRYEWLNGQLFEGEWKQGRKNGYGVWQSPNGDSYIGNWVNGRQHGNGTHTHKNSTFKGEFVSSLKHGFGQESFANGDKFKGSYFQGKPEGKGLYQWTDGSYYEGDFKSGYREGQGLLKQVDGTIYRVKALSKEILNTVWECKYFQMAKVIKSNIIRANFSPRIHWKSDDLSNLKHLNISLYRIIESNDDQTGQGSKKTNLLNSSYSIYPELFLSSFLKSGSIAISLMGNSNFFSIRSNSQGEIYPFLFQSYSLNNFFMRNSSCVPLDFWMSLCLKAFIVYLRYSSVTTSTLGGMYPHCLLTYLVKGSS